MIWNVSYLKVGLLQLPSVNFSLVLIWLSSSCGGGGRGNSSHGRLTLGLWPTGFGCASGETTDLLGPALLGFLLGDPGGDGNLGLLLIEDEVEDDLRSWGPWDDTGVGPLDDCSDCKIGVERPPLDNLTGGELLEGGLDGGTEGVWPLGGVCGGGVFSLEEACLRWGFFGGLSGGLSSLWPFWWLLLKIILDGLLLFEFFLDQERSCGWEALVEEDLRSRLSVRTIGWLYFLRWFCLLSCCCMLPPYASCR